MKFKIFLTAIIAIFFSVGIMAQTTGFTYQGSMTSTGTPASGNHDFEFALFDASAGGSQIGSTLLRSGVSVVNGIFSVNLDFGAVFPGFERFIEIRVRPSGGGAFTALSPRQPLSSAPYAVRSLNAGNSATLEGFPASSFLQPNGNGSGLTNLNATSISSGVLAPSRGGTGLTSPGLVGSYLRSNGGGGWLSSAIQPGDIPANIPGYIQNSNVLQPSSNFNISGTGFANEFSATTGFNIGSIRVLSNAGTFNLFAGVGAGVTNSGSANAFFGHRAGESNTSGSNNAFFGSFAGEDNLAGTRNSFFGSDAGKLMTGGNDNSFFGASAGDANIAGSGNSFFGSGAGGSATGSDNSFFGASAGRDTQAGINNAFFGRNAGVLNTSGSSNSFFGSGAGDANGSASSNAFFGFSAGGGTTNGGSNTFIGSFAGQTNQTGQNNTYVGTSTGLLPGNSSGTGATLIGAFSNVLSNGLSNAAAIGLRAAVGASNSLVLGSIAGVNEAVTDTNVGIGTATPIARLDVRGNVFVGLNQTNDAPGVNNLFVNNDGGDSGNSFRFDGSNNSFFMIARSSASSAVGTSLVFRTSPAGGGETTRMVIHPDGPVEIRTLGTAGGGFVCRNSDNQLSSCSSSRRYKDNIRDFSYGMSLLGALRPVTFDWKSDGKADLGFVAEEVAAIEPLLATYNDKGEIEGVKYDRITTILVNTAKEQQALIEKQQKEIAELRTVICSIKADAKMCLK